MEEIWKDIEGFEGLYMASNLGRIMSLKFKGIRGNGKPKIIKGSYDVYGYLRCDLYNTSKGIRKTFKIHRLIAKTFIPNPLNKPTVNHINENKTDNRVVNLEWATNLEQMKHGTCVKRRSITQGIPIFGIHTTLDKTIRFESMAEAVRNGFHYKGVTTSITENKVYKGYKWYKQSDFEQKENEQCI
ncbi:NUMOD4 domain-containing protein [Staphylococcus shinii]|uniref:NUMOD4 domain-containing protein n=1 Tax=Staphylococcus shinii TaxID=2912228 RepID=UPI00057C07CB|nr:NUMOD4 domain-containing protein [Staphylococcus shinii]